MLTVKNSYWRSLVVYNADGRPVRKLSFDEASTLYPEKNAMTLDRDIRRAWAKLNDKEDDPRFVPNEVAVDRHKVKWHSGGLKLNPEKLTKFVILFDMHFPYEVHMGPVKEFVHDFKPDHLIYGGDGMNMDPFNHWVENTPRESRNMPLPKRYYEEANRELFIPLRAITNAQITYMYGNHEYWALRAIDDDPRGEGFWEPEVNIEGVDQWVKDREVINIGKLHIAHGDMAGVTNVSPARALILKGYHRNLICGHLHTYAVATEVSPIDIEDRHVVEFAPCLTAFNPPFMKNKPHQWTQGFVYGYVEPNGNFHKNTVIISNGRFVANGLLYS